MKKLFCALATVVALANFAYAKTYKLRLATTWENTMPVLGDVANEFKEYAEKLSDGRLEIRVDTPSKHKAGFGIYDFVKSGQYDLGFSALYYYKGKDPKTMLWTAVPFGLNTAERQAWYYYGGGKELADEMFNPAGMKIFPMGSTGIQMGGWFKKEINSLEDLQGLKIRIPGFGGEVMSRLGVSINTIPTGELYMALEMGTIDAVEWVSPVYDMPIGFDKVAKYYYTGWQEPTGDVHLMVNLKSYEKLPADLQLIIEAAARMAGENMLHKGFYENSKIWDKIQSGNSDVEIRQFPPVVLEALKNATNEILDELSSKDEMFKKILDSQKEFQKIGREWYKISDFAYVDSQLDDNSSK
ncbi:MAG: ABC transporter substrate-binding protein [Campylobacter sp.]|nr:ABC transporter substrate-binding protein [Campylobacter sp.]